MDQRKLATYIAENIWEDMELTEEDVTSKWTKGDAETSSILQKVETIKQAMDLRVGDKFRTTTRDPHILDCQLGELREVCR
jgi:hypothetical protein